MKSLSSKSILDRVKRIEKKYAKSSQIIDKHFVDHELEFDLDDLKGTNKSSWKDKKSSQLISKHRNARFEQEASKISRVADSLPSQSVVNLLEKSEESHLETYSHCYSSDDSEIMSKAFGMPQKENDPLLIKTQSNSFNIKASNILPNVGKEVHSSTLKYHNQENKFQVNDGRNNTNIPVNRPQMKLDLKFQEEVNDEIQTVSEKSETPHSNSIFDMHLNIFPFESLANGNNLGLDNEGETKLPTNKNFLEDAADVNSLSQISSSISFPEEILPASNSLKTPSKYSVCENSIDDLNKDSSASFNFNLLSIGELMEDIKSEPHTKGSEQSNKLYKLETLPLANEYNDKPQILDEVINEDETCKSNKTSIHFSPVNSVVKEKSDDISTNNEIKEDIHSRRESSLLVTPFIQVVSDDSHNNVGPYFQLISGRAEQHRSQVNEVGPEPISVKETHFGTEVNGDDATSIDEDIAEELDHSADGSTLCSGDSEQSEERLLVKFSALNKKQSLTSNVVICESVSSSQSLEEENHLIIENIIQKSNENVRLESCDSLEKVQKKKFHDSKLKNIPLINKTGGCHVSCQTNTLFFNESDVFSKKIEEILGSSLLFNPNLANNNVKTDPMKVDVEATSSVLSSPLERGFHWALSQQVELTKHFIQAEYNMYAMCMSAIRELSSDYKPLSMHRHKKKKK